LAIKILKLCQKLIRVVSKTNYKPYKKIYIFAN
jgi:hypothetical protein